MMVTTQLETGTITHTAVAVLWTLYANFARGVPVLSLIGRMIEPVASALK